jgi:uncharacterized protein YgbK (DUF1537 family)
VDVNQDCLLIADDLTGAADACAKFVTAGCSGTVLLTLEAGANSDADADVDVDVLAVNADTRRLDVHAASRRIRDAARLVVASGMRPAIVFKKIDSVLRGHVGAELTEALAALDCTHAIFAPSFPAMGRTVRDGKLVVASPIAPASAQQQQQQQHDIAALLAEQGVRDAASVRLETMAMAMTTTTDARARVLICDAMTQPDLDAIVRVAMETTSAMGGRPLWVGSAGLAQALATHLASQRTRICQQPPLPLQSPTPAESPSESPSSPALTPSVLLFIGSPHAVTRDQLTHVLQARDVIHAHDAAAVRNALAHGRHVLLTSATAAHADQRRGQRTRTVDTDAAAAAMDAVATADAASRRRLAGFVMSGGDTAGDICRVLGADRLRLGGEVADGIPWGLLHGGPASGLPLVLKSGGFGQPDALIACVDFLMTRAAQPAPAAPLRHVYP